MPNDPAVLDALNEVFAAAIDEWRCVASRCGCFTICVAFDSATLPTRHEVVQATGIGSGGDSHADLQVLLLERAAHPGYWQSVTGSQETG
jgi:hypothetical protein